MAKKISYEIDLDAQDANKQLEEVNRNLERIDKSADDARKGMKGMASGIQTLGKRVRTLGTMMKAAGIGLLLTAFAQFKNVLNSNQQAADAMNESMFIMQAVFAKMIQNLAEGKWPFKNMAEVIAQARENAQLLIAAQNEAILGEARLNLERATYEKHIEKLRQVRDDERKALDERIQANQEIAVMLENQVKAAIKNKEAAVEAARIKYETFKTVEAEAEYMQAQAELEEQIAFQVSQRSEMLMNEVALLREAVEINEIWADSSQRQRQAYFERQVAADRWYGYATERELELFKVQAESDKAILTARLQNFEEYSTEYENAMAELTAVEAENAAKRAQLERQIQDDKLAAIKYSLDTAVGLAKEGSELQKALAVAQAIMNTYLAANVALASAPPPWNFIAMGLTIAAGLKNVHAILSTDPENPQVPTQTATAPPIQQTAPGVGVDPGANQIAATIGNALNAPFKAYVVGKDVTTQAELDRQILENATV